jgi:hypothetical protein
MPSRNSSLNQDSNYLTRREAQERRAAEQSADRSARLAHETLADRYAEQLRATTPAASLGTT